MSNPRKATVCFAEPLDAERGRRRPEEVLHRILVSAPRIRTGLCLICARSKNAYLCPSRRRNVDTRRTGHAGVALEGAGVVDGEEEEDVAGGVVGFGEEGEVFFLGGPGALRRLKR